MANYFRITAYHPTENISVIMDSNGMFEKLWQFSAFMVSKGFKIIEVGGEDKFDFGDMDRAPENNEKIYLRACGKSMAVKDNGKVSMGSKEYEANKSIIV